MHLFTYGTLMNPELMHQLLGVHHQYQQYQVSHYRRTALADRHYPGLIFDQSHTTEGLLYLNLTAQEFEILDRYEGSEYEKIEVAEHVQTYLYVGPPALILYQPWPLDHRG